ncbi:unnamed protein product [Adineta ricciae]|uniref:Uncharacterized protein n=1 Tax=Adineta ricciae TaxID=249248 RepID=A0A813NCP0_ADIRI|nr:unnamed protein product [Adineta ricciae]
MTRTNNNNIEHSPSRTSSSSSSAIAQPSSTEPKDIINQNELTIQKLLLELQDDLKQTKECYNQSRDAWLSIQQQQQQQKSSTSPNENLNSQSIKSNVSQALTNVQNEIEMYKTALSKISQVRQLQIEITNCDVNCRQLNSFLLAGKCKMKYISNDFYTEEEEKYFYHVQSQFSNCASHRMIARTNGDVAQYIEIEY